MFRLRNKRLRILAEGKDKSKRYVPAGTLTGAKSGVGVKRVVAKKKKVSNGDKSG